MSDPRINNGVIFGAGSTIQGAVGGANSTNVAHVKAPQAHEIERALADLRRQMTTLTSDSQFRGLVEQDLSEMTAAVTSSQPDQSAFTSAAKSLHRTVVVAGAGIKGAADAVSGLKTLAALFGWSLPFLL